jgi:hypothetical protein
MGDAAVAVTVGLVLAGVVAFRRARGVLTPEARREVAREGIRSRTRRAATVALTVARVAVGVAALAGIVWLTRQLFT